MMESLLVLAVAVVFLWVGLALSRKFFCAGHGVTGRRGPVA
jgi:hypothetical protein